MNQKNIFSVIAALLVLQGIGFFLMKGTIVTSSFPALDEAGHSAAVKLIAVIAALSIMIGLIAYAARSATNVVWAFAIGSAILGAVTIKHRFTDGVNVPVGVMVVQLFIIMACFYLWGQKEAVIK
ncbi:MAG: hypothetical protein ABJC12_08305 [Saprospiraceae bacterium]